MKLRECDIELAATLLQRRRDMQTLLGDAYEKSSREHREFLPAIHERHKGQNLLHSVMKAVKEMDAAGCDPSMLVCAYLDSLERP